MSHVSLKNFKDIKIKNYSKFQTGNNHFTTDPTTSDYIREICHRIQGIGVTGCFNSHRTEFHLRCFRSAPGEPCEVIPRQISDCQCMGVPGGRIHWNGLKE